MPDDDVEGDERARVADVHEVVHRGPADVEADLARDERLERHLLPREGVVDGEGGHGGGKSAVRPGSPIIVIPGELG